jgi:hypothetical protein
MDIRKVGVVSRACGAVSEKFMGQGRDLKGEMTDEITNT